MLETFSVEARTINVNLVRLHLGNSSKQNIQVRSKGRRRQWQPNPVLLPGKSHGRRSLSSLPLFTFMHWRRTWQPTPVFLPGESQGRGSLMGCRVWGHTESDTTEANEQQQQQQQYTSIFLKCIIRFMLT